MNANAPHDANAVALDVDHTIDRALSALRDAQPRSGSEMLAGRILAHLEHRTTAHHITEPGGLPFHSFIVKGWGIARGSAREYAGRVARLTLWTATAAAVFAIASLIILHHRTAPAANGALASAQHSTNAVILSGARSAQSKDPDVAQRTTNAGPFSTTNLAQTTESPQTSIEPTHRMAHRSTMPAACAQPGCPIHDADAPTVMNGVSQTPTDAQLLADLHAPSHPAPPLPLTLQEKLFLRMLRYGNLTQLAELNPEVRAKQDADETTAFKAFFPDPPPLQQPNGDTE